MLYKCVNYYLYNYVVYYICNNYLYYICIIIRVIYLCNNCLCIIICFINVLIMNTYHIIHVGTNNHNNHLSIIYSATSNHPDRSCGFYVCEFMRQNERYIRCASS